MDGHADPRHAWRVGHREVVAGQQRNLADHPDLSALMHHEGAVADADHVHDAENLQAFHDELPVFFVARLQRDLANLVCLGNAFDIDCTDVAAKVADHGCDATETAGSIADSKSDDDAVTCAGSDGCAHKQLLYEYMEMNSSSGAL